jgi:hypothetical protein
MIIRHVTDRHGLKSFVYHAQHIKSNSSFRVLTGPVLHTPSTLIQQNQAIIIIHFIFASVSLRRVFRKILSQKSYTVYEKAIRSPSCRHHSASRLNNMRSSHKLKTKVLTHFFILCCLEPRLKLVKFVPFRDSRTMTSSF